MSSGGRRACCSCDDKCSDTVDTCPFPAITIEFSDIPADACGVCTDGGFFFYDFVGDLSQLNATFYLQYTPQAGASTYSYTLNRVAFNQHVGIPLLGGNSQVWVFDQAGCPGNSATSACFANKVVMDVTLDSDCDLINLIKVEVDLNEGEPASCVLTGGPGGVFVASGNFKFGEAISNEGFCGFAFDLFRFNFLADAGTARVYPTFRPTSLTATINSDGTNCAGCFNWPGSVDAQVVSWDAPRTITLNYLSADADCVTFRFESTSFKWGEVNLFVDAGGCAVASTPSSETVNGKLTVDIKWDGLRWRVVEATGPSNILDYATAGGLMDTDLDALEDGPTCGDGTNKVIREDYTFSVLINEIV